MKSRGVVKMRLNIERLSMGSTWTTKAWYRLCDSSLHRRIVVMDVPYLFYLLREVGFQNIKT